LGPPDGVLGPATRAAIKIYRQDKGIRADITDEQLFELLSLEAIMQSIERATKEVEQLTP
jgi:peptidoglycan hydrolase-like protein with peptidoglycan-binding domain